MSKREVCLCGKVPGKKAIHSDIKGRAEFLGLGLLVVPFFLIRPDDAEISGLEILALTLVAIGAVALITCFMIELVRGHKLRCAFVRAAITAFMLDLS